ncbi:MAG TPA: SDR family oxidoreductase [Gemmatimonadales bacterium]|nr:SDR family oxidoreductase [Gemmatimonadales bacterium]
MSTTSGITAVITGATGGLGLEAAAMLAGQGAAVILVGRDPGRLQAALHEVRGRTGSSAVSGLKANLDSQTEVRQLASDILARAPRLNLLINNAGTVYARRTTTPDGIEATFAVNHLAPYLLTRLLLDRIGASAPARIVTVASHAHYQGTLDLADYGYARGYRIMRAYARSKLGNVLFTRELARRLEGTGVTANALHPGTIATNIWSGAPAWARPVLAVAKRLVMESPSTGAARIAWLATSPDVAGVTGKYFERNRSVSPSALAQDDALAGDLWALSARLVGLPA